MASFQDVNVGAASGRDQTGCRSIETPLMSQRAKDGVVCIKDLPHGRCHELKGRVRAIVSGSF
jgi:hypothetical protein